MSVPADWVSDFYRAADGRMTLHILQFLRIKNGKLILFRLTQHLLQTS